MASARTSWMTAALATPYGHRPASPPRPLTDAVITAGATPGATQRRHGGAHPEHRPAEVHIERALEHGEVDGLDRTGPGHAGVEHDDVEPAEALFGAPHRPLTGGGVGDVTDHRGHRRVAFELLQPVVGTIDRHDGAAAAEHELGRRQADAGGRSGDDRDRCPARRADSGPSGRNVVSPRPRWRA